MEKKRNRRSLSLLTGVAVVAMLHGAPASAVEFAGINFFGYTRFGTYDSSRDGQLGGYTLGGDAQKFRLGNEGDNGLEFGMGKTVELSGGVKVGFQYMPIIWNGHTQNAQAYATVSGLSFAPEAEFWIGQRRLRLQDVHIVDHFFADYGDNYGAGFTGWKLGEFGKLGVGVFNSTSSYNHNTELNAAKRVNVDVSDIQTNPGGSLRVTGTAVSGKFKYGSGGGGLSLVHNQKDFLAENLKHSVFLQFATGHTALGGQFRNLGEGDASAPGVKGWRIVDSLNWQFGKFGGQTIASYESGKLQGGPNDGRGTKDTSLGGRISYAVTNNIKLLLEAGTTTRQVDGRPTQRLNKITFAPALALGPDFWSRPELRFYVTRVNWNAEAALANASGFGGSSRRGATLIGMQLESWWE
jgi:maltoporin